MNHSILNVREYFSKRSPQYDTSSSWVSDKNLFDRMQNLIRLQEGEKVLDVACGTGLIGKILKYTGAQFTGLDYTPGMIGSLEEDYHKIIVGDAHATDFPDGTFDAVICRQGIQFMDAKKCVKEMARIVRPGGRVLLVHLCAHGEEDKEETFEIQRLRNPVRINYFMPEDQPELLQWAGLDVREVENYQSVESALNWLGKGAIPKERQDSAFDVYRTASEAFKTLHKLEEKENDYIDTMLFVIALGVKL